MLWAAALVVQAAIGGLWLDVPFVQQPKNGCGSASVWMVMEYWKAPSIPDLTEIHHELFSAKAGGIYANDMDAYFRRHHFQTFVLRAGWQDLIEQITKGRPLIVALEPGARRAPLHYVVVAGVDQNQDLVWINDPAERKLLPVRRRQFEQQWSATDNWALLVLPEFEAEAQVAVASAAVQHSSELALATTAFREKNFTRAEGHLQSAIKADPEDVLANDFLGTVYLLDNNLDAALKYWNRAGKPKVGEIHVDPPLRIDPIVLDHTFAFSRANILTQDAYHETIRRLDALGILSRYNIELEPTSGEEFNLAFRASERNGAEVLSWIRGLPYRTVYPAWWNIHGRAMNLQSEIRWHEGDKRALVSFSSPARMNSSRIYRIQVDVRNENWQRDGETFNLRRNEVGAEVHAILPHGWNWTNGAAIVHRAFSNSFASGNSVSYKTGVQRTLLRVPEKQLTIDSSAGVQVGKLFGTQPERFAKMQMDADMRWLPFPQHRDDYAIQSRLRLGKSLGQLPFDELFILGLDRDSDLRLRAHPALEYQRKGWAPMGRDFALFNGDFEKRVYSNGLFRVDAGPFVDTARISSQGRWLTDAGLQFRISLLGAVKLGVSFGRDLHTGRNAIFVEGSK